MHIAQVKRDMWLEYRVTRQISTGNGEHYLAQWRVPGWFAAVELGLGLCEGPSILYTMTHLPDINRRNNRQLAEQEGETLRPLARTKARQKRMSAAECAVRLRRKAQQMAAAG
jgi:hypothetical protein